MANIRGAGAAEFAAGMFGVREANLANRKAEQDMEFAQAREDRAAAEFEAKRDLEDRQEDRLVREMDLRERQFALEEQQTNAGIQLTKARTDAARFALSSSERQLAAANELQSTSVTLALAEQRPDFLSQAGNDLYDQLSLLQKRYRMLSESGQDTSAVGQALATQYALYKAQAAVDGRVTNARALLGSIRETYEMGLGESVPENVEQLSAQLNAPGSNGLTGATEDGQLMSDTTIEALQKELAHAQRMVTSRKARQWQLEQVANIGDQLLPGLSAARQKVENDRGQRQPTGDPSAVDEWYKEYEDLQRDIVLSDGRDKGALQARIDSLATRGAMLAVNDGQGAVEYERNQKTLAAEREAFEQEYRDYQVFTAMSELSDMGELSPELEALLSQVGGTATFDRDGGLFDPRFGDRMAFIDPDDPARAEQVRQIFRNITRQTGELWSKVPKDERTARRLTQTRRDAVRAVSNAYRDMGKNVRAAESPSSTEGTKASRTLEAMEATERATGTLPQFAPGSNVSRSAVAQAQGFKGNLDQQGEPVDVRMEHRGTGIALIRPQALQTQEAVFDTELGALVPNGDAAERGVIAALIQAGYVEPIAMDLRAVGVDDRDMTQEQFYNASIDAGTKQMNTRSGRRKAAWAFTNKAQELLGGGRVTMDALFDKLGKDEAARILDHADDYNPREPKRVGGQQMQVGYRGDSAHITSTNRAWYGGKTKKAKPKPKKKVKLPGSYPEVQNPDGTVSNVLMATFEVDGRHYALPTMAGGKQLSDPFAAAEDLGLSEFPNFATQKEAEQWISENHGNITGTDD